MKAIQYENLTFVEANPILKELFYSSFHSLITSAIGNMGHRCSAVTGANTVIIVVAKGNILFLSIIAINGDVIRAFIEL